MKVGAAWLDTLLGPEETGHQPLESEPPSLRGGWFGGGGRVLPGASGVAQGFRLHGLPGCVGGVAVCFLRTAQWTRAS